MSNILNIFFGATLNSIALLYCCSTLINDNQKINIRLFCLYAIIVSLYLTVIYLSISNFMKIFITFLVINLVCMKIFKKKVITSALATFISLILLLISEILCAIILIIIFGDITTGMWQQLFGALIINVFISLVTVLLVNIKPFKNLCRKIIGNLEQYQKQGTIIAMIVSNIVLAMAVYYAYFQANLFSSFFLILTMVMLYSLLSLKLYSEKGNNLKLQLEYEVILQSLKEYEKLYLYQRMLNHEFKNDLMIIRGMTSKKNKKLLNYIDERVDYKKNLKAKWLDTLRRIPEGGLLGILYYKLLVMEQNKIEVNIDIGRNFKSEDYIQIDEKLKSKICKLLGIYLDNAIQAVLEIKDKNIDIIIDEKNNYFEFTVNNKFNGFIELSKINDKGYTTNGNGRGYGLAIAKEILEKENNIINETRINGNVFSQKIKIKM